jgi:hypothetical protein
MPVELTLREKLRAKIQDKSDSRSRAGSQRPVPSDSFDVYSTVTSLLQDKRKMSVPALNKKYIVLRQKYPELFDMCLKKNINKNELNMLARMLETREKMRDGDITTEKADELVKETAFEVFHPGVVQKLAEEAKTLDTDADADADNDVEIVEL